MALTIIATICIWCMFNLGADAVNISHEPSGNVLLLLACPTVIVWPPFPFKAIMIRLLKSIKINCSCWLEQSHLIHEKPNIKLGCHFKVRVRANMHKKTTGIGMLHKDFGEGASQSVSRTPRMVPIKQRKFTQEPPSVIHVNMLLVSSTEEATRWVIVFWAPFLLLS